MFQIGQSVKMTAWATAATTVDRITQELQRSFQSSFALRRLPPVDSPARFTIPIPASFHRSSHSVASIGGNRRYSATRGFRYFRRSRGGSNRGPSATPVPTCTAPSVGAIQWVAGANGSLLRAAATGPTELPPDNRNSYSTFNRHRDLP